MTNASSAFYVTTPGSSSSANLTALTNAQVLANTYLSNIANNSWAVNNGYQLQLLYSQSQQTQVFLAASVPEPATWAMMMLGFGAMGFAIHRKSVTMARIRVA